MSMTKLIRVNTVIMRKAVSQNKRNEDRRKIIDIAIIKCDTILLISSAVVSLAFIERNLHIYRTPRYIRKTRTARKKIVGGALIGLGRFISHRYASKQERRKTR